MHRGVSGGVTCSATGSALGRMHSFLDEGVIFMDDGLLDAAHRVLFAVVGQKQQEYPFLAQLREFLKQYVEARPAVAGAEVPSLSERAGLVCSRCVDYTASRRAALGPFALYDAYRDAVMRAGGLVHARVDLDLLFRVVPADWAPIVAAMISEGPEAAAARAQTAVYDFSLQSVHANRRRGAGRRSASSVKLAVVEARRLFDVAYRLRGLPACECWTYVPEIELPQMPRGGYEVLAPRIEVVRGALHAMTCDIQTRLGVSALEEELAAIDALSDHAMFTSGLWRPMRDRLLLVLMILTGGRKSAIARLRREDYIPDYVGPAPDCRRGAALDLRPQKGKHRDEVRRKPIPRQAALVVDSYLRLIDRWLAGQEQPPAVPSMPLLVAMPGQRHVQPSWIHVRAAGKIGGQRPLVVRDPRQLPKHVTPEEAPYCGYTPHEFRHLANQIAEGAGRIFNERYPATGGEVNPPIPYYAAALLDNGGAERDMRALYGDRKAPAMIEVIAGRATEIGWEILTTGVGLRKRPNVEAYEQELIRLRRIEDEERRLEQAAHRLQAKHARPGPLPALPAGEMGETNRLEVIMRRQEDLIALVEELKRRAVGGLGDNPPARAAFTAEGRHDQEAGPLPAGSGDVVGGGGHRSPGCGEDRLGSDRQGQARQAPDARRECFCGAGLADVSRVLRDHRSPSALDTHTLGEGRTPPGKTRPASVGARLGARRRHTRHELSADLGARRQRHVLAHPPAPGRARKHTLALAAGAGLDHQGRRAHATVPYAYLRLGARRRGAADGVISSAACRR